MTSRKSGEILSPKVHDSDILIHMAWIHCSRVLDAAMLSAP